jgi:glycosyltransferase involved in cell wall biosynthesis
LRSTIESVARQTDPRLDLYVVDGASSDGTPEFLESSGDTVTAWLSEPDAGIYDAMNKGWRLPPDDAYVIYLGAGDRLMSVPDSSELLGDDGKPCPVVLGRCDIGSQPFRSRWTAELRLRNTAHHQALMIRKAVWPDTPFDCSLRVYGDWDFNLRLLGLGVKAKHVHDLHTYAEPGGVSWNHNLPEIWRVARRHGGPLIAAASYALNSVAAWRVARG